MYSSCGKVEGGGLGGDAGGKVEGGGLGGDAGGVMRCTAAVGRWREVGGDAGGVMRCVGVQQLWGRWSEVGCRWSGTNRMYDPHDTGWLCELIDKGLNPLLLMNCSLIHVKCTHLGQCGVLG